MWSNSIIINTFLSFYSDMHTMVALLWYVIDLWLVLLWSCDNASQCIDITIIVPVYPETSRISKLVVLNIIEINKLTDACRKSDSIRPYFRSCALQWDFSIHRKTIKMEPSITRSCTCSENIQLRNNIFAVLFLSEHITIMNVYCRATIKEWLLTLIYVKL